MAIRDSENQKKMSKMFQGKVIFKRLNREASAISNPNGISSHANPMKEAP
jgi:hypothetical protein